MAEQTDKSIETQAVEAEVVDDVERPEEFSDGGKKTEYPKLTDDQIAAHVKKINNMVEGSLLKTVIKVGKYVLEHFFDNDIQNAMSKNPNKPTSFRKLQDHKDLKIPYSTLSQMVRVAAQDEYLIKKLGDSNLKELTYSHRIELLRIDNEDKIPMAEKCITESLSVRSLRDEIKGSRSRKQTPGDTILSPSLSNILKGYFNEDESLEKLSFKKITRIKTNIDNFLNRIEEIKIQFTELREKIDPLYTDKKEKAEAPKEQKKRGRRKKGEKGESVE